MNKDRLTFWEYLKAAFHSTWKVTWLGHLPLNKLFLVGMAILGFANPGFWLLGVGLEVGFLLLLAGSERFQKVIRAGRIEQSTQTWEERQGRILKGLGPESQHRYRQLIESGKEVLQSAENLSAEGMGTDLRAESLNQLNWVFLRLLASHHRIRQILAQTSRGDLEREITTLTEKIAREEPASPLFRSMQGTLEIQKRRLENLLQAESRLKVVEAELDRIEKHVTLLREESQVSTDPTWLTERLDGVMDSLQGTSRWMAENNELFGSLEETDIPPMKAHERERI